MEKKPGIQLKMQNLKKMAKFIKEHINHTSVSVSHTTMKSKLATTARIFIGLILSDEDFSKTSKLRGALRGC